MKKSNKILLGIVLALIFVIGCGAAGFMKASHHPAATEKVTKTTKQVSKPDNDKKANVTSDNQQTTASNTNAADFSKTPWTSQSALDFLQKVNDSSSEGAKVASETTAKYAVYSNSGDFPGNSIYVTENNRSGAGDGGVLLTKNDDNTVTLTIGEGAGASPDLKAVIDAKTYQVLSKSEISNNDKSMWQYFGVKEPGSSSSSDNDSSSDDSSNDNSSDSNNDNSQSSDTNKNDDNSDD